MIQNKTLVHVYIIAVIALVAYFGWWKRRCDTFSGSNSIHADGEENSLSNTITGIVKTVTIGIFLIRFLGFKGSGVHASLKYGFMRLFLKNTPFNRISSLQFSGLLLVTFFATCFMLWGGQKAAGSPLLPANAITSEKLGENRGNPEETAGNVEIHTNVRGGTSGQPCHQSHPVSVTPCRVS